MTSVDMILEMFAVVARQPIMARMFRQTEHALQTTHLAIGAGADDELVAAALLHDIGHLLRVARERRRTRDP